MYDAKFWPAPFSKTEGSSRSGLRNANLQEGWEDFKVDSVIVKRRALHAMSIYSKIQESGTFHPLCEEPSHPLHPAAMSLFLSLSFFRSFPRDPT